MDESSPSGVSLKDLSPAEFLRLSALWDESIDMPPDEREAWLAALERSDFKTAALLRELCASLDESRERGFLETRDLVASHVASLVEVPDSAAPSGLSPGRRVGPYELERLLGAGGMAEVWLARRADGAFKREVALKLPMVSRLRKDLEDRFTRERDILAQLEHPNIARLYDGGVDAEGLPYLAMEYVPGQSITAWCDAKRLDTAQRLTLLHRVLEAVHYAHEHRIIHRDLKPSNILVSEAGEVRLLDFGVAKLLEDTESSQFTRMYGRVFTLEYASPEQVRGDALDARSDVYSIGVVLYELLTGKRPYALDAGAPVGTLEHAISTVEVKKPSTQLDEGAATGRGTTRDKLAQALRGDLDVITLKALAKDPIERYESAAAMAEDIERYLQHRPIRARPALLLYRGKKFLRRHRPMIAVTALAGAVVLAAGSYEFEHWWATHLPPPLSIAVMPLANEGGEASQQYFSDGISEDLIAALSHFPELKVIGRSSAFKFRDSKEDARSIGAKLGVAHLLEGKVLRLGEMVRVSAELIDTSDGSTQWSERYDRPYQDLFRLQDEITRSVASALKAKLVRDEHAAAQSDHPPSGNFEAYNALLQGRFYAARNTEADVRKSIAYFTRAIELDPNYAIAWGRLSRAWTTLRVQFVGGTPAQEAYANAKAAADRAIVLSPDLEDSHLAQGLLLQNVDLDWSGAQAEFRRAEELAPNDGEAKFELGRQLASSGHLETAIDVTRQALATEPLRANWYYWLAADLSGLNRYDEAERAIRKAIELQPTAQSFHQTLTIIEVQRGHAQAALEAAQQEPAGLWRDSALALALQIGTDRAAADAALRTLIGTGASLAPYQIAQVYALRQDANQTFAWLDRAWSNRDPGINYFLFDPFIQRYRDDPRFAAFCRKVGLPVSPHSPVSPSGSRAPALA